MADYRIDITSDAKGDLAYYSANERKLITQGIRSQLAAQPALETKNRKQLRDNPIGPWEVRVGIYRVFYEVDEVDKQVIVVSIGHKEHNVLYIRGKEVML